MGVTPGGARRREQSVRQAVCAGRAIISLTAQLSSAKVIPQATERRWRVYTEGGGHSRPRSRGGRRLGREASLEGPVGAAEQRSRPPWEAGLPLLRGRDR